MGLTGFPLDFTTVTLCQGAEHRTLGSVPENQALGVDGGQEESPDSQFHMRQNFTKSRAKSINLEALPVVFRPPQILSIKTFL